MSISNLFTRVSFTSVPAFKETAFLLAVSSAALTHALAKACSSGRMERCTCDDSPGIQHREAWQWGVCGDNLKYSTKFLKKFLGQKKVSKDLRARVDAHNINVGIRVSANKGRPERCGAETSHQMLLEPHKRPSTLRLHASDTASSRNNYTPIRGYTLAWFSQ